MRCRRRQIPGHPSPQQRAAAVRLADGQTIVLVRTIGGWGIEQAAETSKVVRFSRHGKPVAVLISEQSYATLQVQQASRRVWAAISEWRQSGEAIGELEVESWRDRSQGREVSFG